MENMEEIREKEALRKSSVNVRNKGLTFLKRQCNHSIVLKFNLICHQGEEEENKNNLEAVNKKNNFVQKVNP